MRNPSTKTRTPLSRRTSRRSDGLAFGLTWTKIRAWKNDRYALLWAVRFAAERRRPKVAWLQRAFHVVRDCLLKGALFRGGLDALRIAWAVSSYHAAKYAYLAAVRSGDHVELLDAFQGEQYEQLFRLLS